ncbi:hypothetical protein OU798_13140 [Prolixibacteraceae bacterium Z1-6]|uniref:OMP85-like membrane spanning beta-barrel domain-containing protein n=1 Tax=Draconibacterium aestuarii TaxID=2998507 RepID=A0A9X3F7L0_9BACT|nr:hypothetical protein [Prolixibacteraceae bacterium Z1-6]
MGDSRLQFKNLAGFNLGEIYTSNVACVKWALNIELTTGLYLSGTLNMATTANRYNYIFNDLPNKNIDDYIWGYNFGVKYNSLLGPIQLLISDNNRDSKTRVHFSIGFPF